MPGRELEVGGTLGPYRIVRELGRGGMGVVYEGVHTHLRRRVAIKVMRPELAADPAHVERFVREGRAASRIGHPNAIDVYEFDFADGAPYLVMDYLEGETLAERLRVRGPLPLPELLATMLPVISAVAAAHAKGVVHRDLKPHNVMLARDENEGEIPKVLDFGTSKLLAPEELSLTNSAALFGTPHYMAPEQARSARDVDARTDQYALGVILFECATGRRPFEGEHAFELLHAIMSAPVAPPGAIVPELPPAFDAAVLRAMSRDPEQRFPDVRALGAVLCGLAPQALAAIWAPVFGPAPAPEPSGVEVAAVPTLAPAKREASRAAEPRARRLAPALLAVALFAALAAAWSLLGLARRDGGARAAEPPAPAAPPAAERGVAAATRVDRSAAGLEAPAAATPAVAAPPAQGETMRAAERAERDARSRAKSATGQRRTTGSHGHPATGPHPAPPPVPLGDNGAPILE